MRKSIASLFAAATAILLSLGIAGAHGKFRNDPWTPTATPTPPTGATPTPTPAPAPLTTFSNANFSGNYAASFSGTQDGTGILTADGNGNILTGTETFNDGTDVCTGTVAGTYSVNPDGTGTMTLTFTLAATGGTIAGTCPSTSMNHAAIALASDHHIAVSETDAGEVVIGTLIKQHSRHGHHLPPPLPWGGGEE